MKTLLLFFLLVLYAMSYSLCQEVIATSGEFNESNDGSVSWTIGEMATQTLENNDVIVTQGFHQTNLTITVIKELKKLDVQITAYPNPVTNMVKIKIESKMSDKLSYTLVDANGKLLIRQLINSNETEIPFIYYAPSVYFLKVYDSKREIKTFKIIKNL